MPNSSHNSMVSLRGVPRRYAGMSAAAVDSLDNGAMRRVNMLVDVDGKTVSCAASTLAQR